MYDEPIMLYWVIASHKLIAKMAYLGALASRVAIRNSRKVDIGIGISPDQVEHVVEAKALTITVVTQPIAACIFMACEQFNCQCRHLKEGIHK